MDGHTELKKGRVAFKLINWSDNISNVLNSKNFLSRGPKHFSYGATVSAKYTFTSYKGIKLFMEEACNFHYNETIFSK